MEEVLARIESNAPNSFQSAVPEAPAIQEPDFDGEKYGLLNGQELLLTAKELAILNC